LVKFDLNGNVDWEKTYGGKKSEDWAGEDIDLTADGGAIVAVDNGKFGFLKIEPFQ
jgi:S-formylglutathione hydrolase FrmB